MKFARFLAFLISLTLAQNDIQTVEQYIDCLECQISPISSILDLDVLNSTSI